MEKGIINLSKIKKVSLKKVWKEGEISFSNWLAKQENMKLLAEELGLKEINVKKVEAKTGKYSLDILAEDENEKIVIIENQLEKTDHKHLGQLITYGAGFEASINIWIVSEVEEEHKSSINWLNEITNNNNHFFLVKIEIWQIDNSNYAPKFEIISKPDYWRKYLKENNSTNISENGMRCLDFIKEFKEYYEETKGKLITIGTPQISTPNYYVIKTLKFGRGWVFVKTSLRLQKLKIGVYIKEKEKYYELKEKQFEIDKEFENIFWNDLENNKGSTIQSEIIFDIEKEDKKEYFEWLKRNIDKYYDVFNKLLN
jgi:hypothetical protein